MGSQVSVRRGVPLAIVIGATVVLLAGLSAFVRQQLLYVAQEGLASTRFIDCASGAPGVRETCYRDFLQRYGGLNSCIAFRQRVNRSITLWIIRKTVSTQLHVSPESDCITAAAVASRNIQLCEAVEGDDRINCLIFAPQALPTRVLFRGCPELKAKNDQARCFVVLRLSNRQLSSDERAQYCQLTQNTEWATAAQRDGRSALCAGIAP
jgi:hypothetical protein